MDFDIWRKNVINAARRAASREYQERVWFGRGPERDSPDDLLCTFLDDLDFTDFLRHPMLSPSERISVARLDDAVEAYSDCTPKHLDPSAVIDDPLFENVRIAARDFLTTTET